MYTHPRQIFSHMAYMAENLVEIDRVQHTEVADRYVGRATREDLPRIFSFMELNDVFSFFLLFSVRTVGTTVPMYAKSWQNVSVLIKSTMKCRCIDLKHHHLHCEPENQDTRFLSVRSPNANRF